jgi:hypothetical protein
LFVFSYYIPNKYNQNTTMKGIFTSAFLFIATSPFAQNISLTGSTYSHNFNTLSDIAGTTTNNLTITGWFLTESGGGARDNEQYAVDNGGLTTGDMYSYGSSGSTDRALGALRTGTLIPSYGAAFTNNTGSAITNIKISFTGEEWRLGAAFRTDELDFQYSTNATDLTTGTWTGVAALNFVTPNTGTGAATAMDGNNATNRTALTATITGLNIANGASFFIRWVDIDVAGADDGLAVDDFSLETNVVLPLTLVNFSAVKEDAFTKINWTTAEENNTSLFKVQRSMDGVTNWQTVATVAASGESNRLMNYQAVDAKPGTGNNYYRLMSVDLDDKFTHSAIRRVNFDQQYTMGIYPNPVNNILTITTDNATGIKGQLIIVNMQGQAVLPKHVANGSPVQHINVASLKTGIYFLRIINDNGNISTIKFVRE